MADNLTVTPGSGVTVAADEIAGVKYQRVKLSIGSDGSATDAVGGAGAVDAGVQRVTIATNDQTASHINNALVGDYETIAASQTDQALGTTGGVGDYLIGMLIVPATTSPGAVQIKDGGGSAITVFAGGSSSVSNLVPFFVPLGARSYSGGWSVTTGANVSVIAVGNFT